MPPSHGMIGCDANVECDQSMRAISFVFHGQSFYSLFPWSNAKLAVKTNYNVGPFAHFSVRKL